MISLRHRLLFFAVLHLACCAFLVLILRSPPALAVNLGTAPDERFTANFLPPERSSTTTFRWSSNGSRLLLYGTGGRQVQLSLRINGDLRAQSSDRTLLLHADEQQVAAFALQPGWRTYHTLLPPHATGTSIATTPLDLRFASYRLIPDDSRHLGTPLERIEAVPRASTVAWQQVLLLTWVLAVMSGFVCTIVTTRWQKPVAVVLALLLLWWAWQSPYTLAWFLATQVAVALPWLLGVATLVLLLVWCMPRLPHTALHIPHAAPLMVLILAHLLLLLPLPVVWRSTIALVVVGMPGALLADWLLRPHATDPDDAPRIITRLFVWLCGAIALPPFLLLTLHAIPGPLTWWMLLLVCDGISLALLVQKRVSPDTDASYPMPNERGGHGYEIPVLVGVLLIGAMLRLLFLGSSEFQGDEGRAILMATGVMQGQDEILLLHRKGPTEILLPAAAMLLTGHLNEWGARLPFALAGIGVLLGVVALTVSGNHATRQHRPSLVTALVAAAVLALEGYLIAFSRIVQYQSTVALMSLAAAWCCWRFYNGSPHPQRSLLGAAWMVAAGFLAHYDAIYVVPALVWLVVAGALRRGGSLRQWVGTLALPVLVGAALLASFYLPFMLHERFGRTAAYLVGRTGQQEMSGALFNNLALYALQGTFYNTTFQVYTLVGVLAAALLVWLWRADRARGMGRVLAVLLLTGCVIQVWHPPWFEVGGINLALVAFGVPVAGLALLSTTPAALRMLLLWFGVPFVALLFLINDPRTHVYTIHTPAALLIGMSIGQLVAWLHARHQRTRITALAAVGVSLVLLALPYLCIVYVRQSPEYYRTFPAHRPPLYHASYGDTLPTDEGYFGFPRRDGWKVIGALYHQGVLEGDYDCNQKPRITGWYTRGAFRCGRDPAYYILALHEPVTSRSQRRIAAYHLFGTVLVNNHKTMEIYSREPVDHPPHLFDLEQYIDLFESMPVSSFPLQQSLPLIPGLPQYHLDAEWQSDMLLKGYDLDRQQVSAGQTATLSLYWFPLTSEESSADLPEPERLTHAPLRDYELVVNVLDSDGRIAAQATPHCGSVPPAEWHSRYEWLTYFGETAFTITPDVQMPAGDYTLEVGLRHTTTGAWLPLVDGRETLYVARLWVEG